MKTILIVEDEPKLLEVVSSYLKNEGFHTLEALNATDALKRMNKDSIDFVVLDLMLPDMSGEELCQRIRQAHTIPILMLTAKVKEEDRINGLALGADDYMAKPFSPRELVMRIKTILRRSGNGELLAEQVTYNGGDLKIDAGKQEVFVKGETVNLTPNEYKLLLTFGRHPNRVFSREELVEKILGFDFEGDSRTIDQHVKNLRYKLENDPKNPTYIVTVFGVGYKFTGGGHV
ncbi:two-component system response regulator [Fictibacillus phosphorivorans]|uniref:Two-component system response regulator n=1 Tax=Fictibacillus phosphorivorans TaxID=1221500 RepID=A0A165NPW0_9BACL|nr:response regulator transcription factor [Fictibacillus phosphorivorans]KZE67138.1 two-component system response regulator [Fictibacillus phosphorivorans]